MKPARQGLVNLLVTLMVANAAVLAQDHGDDDAVHIQGNATRICTVYPTIEGNAGNAGQAAQALLQGFSAYLKGPALEAVPVKARVSSQIRQEGAQSHCDFYLFSTLTLKRSSHGSFLGRTLGGVAYSASGQIPGGSSAASAIGRSVAIEGAREAAEFASSIRAKDQLKLDCRLEAADGKRPALAHTWSAKARSDGEDTLSTLLTGAAEAIVTFVVQP